MRGRATLLLVAVALESPVAAQRIAPETGGEVAFAAIVAPDAIEPGLVIGAFATLRILDVRIGPVIRVGAFDARYGHLYAGIRAGSDVRETGRPYLFVEAGDSYIDGDGDAGRELSLGGGVGHRSTIVPFELAIGATFLDEGTYVIVALRLVLRNEMNLTPPRSGGTRAPARSSNAAPRPS